MDIAALTEQFTLRFRSMNNAVKQETVMSETSISTSGQVKTTTHRYPYFDGELKFTADPGNSLFVIARELDRRHGQNLLNRFDYGGMFWSSSVRNDPPKARLSLDRTISIGGASINSKISGVRFPCSSAHKAMSRKPDSSMLSDGPSRSYLFGLGSEMIARTLPTVPELQLSVSLAELAREGLPRIPKVSKNLKGTADEFLNFQFGIMPIVSDLEGLDKTLSNWEKLVAQLWRDDGKLVRRRVKPVTTTSTEVYEHRTPVYPIAYLYNDREGNKIRTCRHTTTTESTTWFSAAYRYNLPDLDGFRKTIYEFRRLLGLDLSPEVLWNLLPWSWLVDWFATTSSWMKNISYLGLHGVSIHHAYLMCTEKSVTKYENAGITCSTTNVVKTRTKASPFGFGLKSKELSPKQLAILSALGISRVL